MGYPIPREYFFNIKHDQRPAIDRAGEQIAKALEAARQAISLMENIQFAAFKLDRNAVDDLAKITDATHVLTDDFRHQIHRLLADLDGAKVTNPSEQRNVRSITDQLETAHKNSQSVDDLIAAEKVVATKRNLKQQE